MTNPISPYDKLAFIYDQMMSHVDYRGWRDYILELIAYSQNDVQSLIDLSCGTGNMLRHLKGKIGQLYGCDYSPEMVAVARLKKALKGIPLFISDIKQIAVSNNRLDSALFLYDSLNYILDETSLRQCFCEVGRILKREGLFIFDVVTVRHCREYYADFHESEYWGDEGYTRHSYFNVKKSMQHNNFRIVIQGETFIERHIQKIHRQSELERLLTDCGFDIAGVFDEFTLKEANHESGRIHFLCIKK